MPTDPKVDYRTEPVALPALEARVRRPGRHARAGRRRGRRRARRLQAQAQLVRPGRRHRACTTRCSASASSTPKCAASSSRARKDRIFCSGANIFMLGLSSHAWKVNFCKFTNETRNGIEDASRHSGLKFLAAVNGTCAGGGYELALACDEIWLIDDRSSSVSLPEVPLLGVLPGTGGLTRVTDKRHVRHDLADVFCTRHRRRARPAREGLAARRRDRRSRASSRRPCARARWRSRSAATGPRRRDAASR